ncbi:MAG: hypothetical protein ACHQEB_05490 [Chitinophagales bacterium]
MTPRSLFNIILKIIGIFFILKVLEAISQLLIFVIFLSKSDLDNRAILVLVTTIVVLLAYGIASYLLVFKTGLIIDILKLEKGFNQETIPLNLHRSSILSISIIVVGGFLIATEIPNISQHLYTYFQRRHYLSYDQIEPSLLYIITSGAKIIVGILLITGQRRIVNFIEVRRKK